MPRIPWDEYYMNQAFAIAEASKDPSSRVGCIIVSSDNSPISQGFNGFPKGCDEKLYTWDRPLKYYLVLHAEMNALAFARKKELNNAKIYITHHPCDSCLKQLIQEGITEFIYEDYDITDRFSEEQKKAIDIMVKANNISLRKYVRKGLL